MSTPAAIIDAPLFAMRWRPFRLPLRHRFEAAHGALADRTGVLVECVAADGTRGIGEASPLPSLGDGTAGDVLALLAAHGAALLRGDLLLPTGPGVAALRCALDAARLDIEGRQRGLPVAALLSPAHVLEVRVNAVIGTGTPDEVARYGREALAAGYEVLKLKVAVGTLDADIASVAALRAACPGAPIRLDANGAWSEAQAAEALERLAALRIELIEQPVAASNLDALARLRGCGVRIAADEAAASPEAGGRVVAARAADLLVLKPMRLGGVRPAFALAQSAWAAGLPSIATTTFDSSIGTAVALHLAAALDGLGAGGLGAERLAQQQAERLAHGLSTGDHLADDLVQPSLLPAGGRLRLRNAPGLGVGLGIEVDAAALDRLATGPWVECGGRA